MKTILKKALIFFLCFGVLWAGVAFRRPFAAFGIKVTNLSASFWLTGGLSIFWKTEKDQENTTPAIPIKEPADSSVSALPPTPPEGVKTGKVQTKTLPLSAANTAGEGVHINNQTGVKIDPKEILEQGLPFSLTNTREPQVLIVHTHATECYLQGDYGYYISSASTRTTDNTQNTVRVGQVLAETLNAGGIVTLNDDTQHDYPNYTGSYTRSRTTIENYLKQYPAIQVVIDLHRDAIGGGDDVKIKPTAVIGGKQAAQIMILAGAELGSVENFPNWQKNFQFCLQLQRQLETDYEGLCRPLLFKACKYNFDLLPGSILIEVGTDANTLAEAEYSAALLGQSLLKILTPS